MFEKLKAEIEDLENQQAYLECIETLTENNVSEKELDPTKMDKKIVSKIVYSNICQQSYPCKHDVRIVYSDNSVENKGSLDGKEIAKLFQENKLPVDQHFADYQVEQNNIVKNSKTSGNDAFDPDQLMKDIGHSIEIFSSISDQEIMKETISAWLKKKNVDQNKEQLLKLIVEQVEIDKLKETHYSLKNLLDD